MFENINAVVFLGVFLLLLFFENLWGFIQGSDKPGKIDFFEKSQGNSENSGKISIFGRKSGKTQGNFL